MSAMVAGQVIVVTKSDGFVFILRAQGFEHDYTIYYAFMCVGV